MAYRIWRYVRFLLILAVLSALTGAVFYFIQTSRHEALVEAYDRQLVMVRETAIANALFTATRTAEAPLPQYRLLRIQNESLEQIAERYHTTVDVLRLANAYNREVYHVDDATLIIPEGVQELDPPRQFITHQARPGQTLAQLAEDYDLPLSLLETDNPILAQRGVNPGDIVFIAIIL
jgi:LysM repeat protein